MADMTSKNRQSKRIGELNARAKLNVDQVRYIRKKTKSGVVAWLRHCAEKFDVSVGCICGAYYGKNWSHV